MAQWKISFAAIFASACCLLTSVLPTPPLIAQQEKPATAAYTAVHATTMNPGDKPLQRDLKGGDTHAYTLHVDSGLFIHFVADQLGIDVALTLYAPDGRKIASMDSPNGTFGVEQISTVASNLGRLPS